MVGTIHRVTVYDDILPDAAIMRHAKAFTRCGAASDYRFFHLDPEFDSLG